MMIDYCRGELIADEASLSRLDFENDEKHWSWAASSSSYDWDSE